MSDVFVATVEPSLTKTLKSCTIPRIQQDATFFFFVLPKFRFFSVEVIREMDNNVRLDKGYLSVSERRGQSEASLLFFRTADKMFTAAGHSGEATYLY